MIRCLVVDDEPLARKLLEDFISKTPGLHLVDSCSSALAARATLTSTTVDVIFLDIQMPDITGIDFLKTMVNRPAVILTTAFAEYALEGFELDVIDYLLKPFDFNRFLKAVNKIPHKNISVAEVETKSTKNKDFLFVKDGTRLFRITLSDLLYIKGAREYVTLVTTEKKVTSLQSMKSLASDLPENFIRIHNSYIVNMNHIDEIRNDEVVIKKTTLPIGISYKRDFLSKIKVHLKK